MSITVNGKVFDYKKGIRVKDFINDGNKEIISCKINNKLRDLSYEIEDNSVVKLLDLQDEDSVRVYEASLRFLFVMAVKRVFPELIVNCDYYISRSICFWLEKDNFNEEQLEVIKETMSEIVKSDYPFVRSVVSIQEALDFYKENNYEDKVKVYKYRENESTHMYNCDGYVNYMYSYMVPSTGYLTKYNLLLHNGMIILQYPRAEEKGEIPTFVVETTYENTLLKATEWGKKIDSLTVGSINKNIVNNPKEFVDACEKRHADMIEELTKKIKSKKNLKLIAIAGPSSSGKTTFSNKLRMSLEKVGIYPVKISMDDYYLDRSDLTPEEESKMDYENINLIDIELFNKHMKELSDGKEVTLPRFDFVTKKRVVGKTMKLDKNAPIIIEGIHALNEVLTSSLSRDEKFEIYIGPHIQVNMDNHNPISITHLRLIRRLVRDYRTRGAKVLRTLSMWDSVRKGEFRWIYDNQEGVDFVYNSILDYEFSVLKKYAVPLLESVTNDSKYYNLATILIRYLKYFVDLEDDYIPHDSLLREFIGNSCFEE